MTITICIGSSCHLKGSREVIACFQKLISEKDLAGQIQLAGDFCSGSCAQGVVVTVDGRDVYSVSPDTARSFFENTILPGLA
ncbi:MAG: (2Fe-2S) ferredoxin domain-containing protein [Lachnospiraceae bacterium]|nr:(2Fe-2S) ferredoxin domain-containing protein [Lachnospiraceae bacterium]